MTRGIACVTGASGVIGGRIAARLVAGGYSVRALSRHPRASSELEYFRGDLVDEEALSSFLDGAGFVFHCAAELLDPAEIWRTNVSGTEALVRGSERAGVSFFCNLSSVGVFGRVAGSLVDEETECRPGNLYEQSKLAAEKAVAAATGISTRVTLRPTNVVAPESPGTLTLAVRRGPPDAVKTFVQGRERAHVVHAENVAAAAIHMLDVPPGPVDTFIVSADHEPMNSLRGLWELAARSLHDGSRQESAPAGFPSLPIAIPQALRRIARGDSNPGTVVYSSRKLLASGFRFPLDLNETVADVVRGWRERAPGGAGASIK